MDFRPGFSVPAALTGRKQVHSTYSYLDGVTRETPGEMVMTGVRYRPGGVTVRLGDHPYAAELASLGLPKRALMSSSAANVAMTSVRPARWVACRRCCSTERFFTDSPTRGVLAR